MSTQKTIFVVDDDKDLVQSVKTFLEARNYHVVTANSGEEGRAWLDKNRPDAIVLDIMMESDTAGFNLAYKLHADDSTRSIPVVILSGFMNHLDSKYSTFEFIQGRDWPAAKFFEKPVNLKDLADSIGRLIAEAEALRANLAEAAG